MPILHGRGPGELPGCYFLLGTRNGARGLVHPHHSPRFDIDKSARVIGVDIMTRVVRL